MSDTTSDKVPSALMLSEAPPPFATVPSSTVNATIIRGEGLPFTGHRVERDSIDHAISAAGVSAVNSCGVSVFLAWIPEFG